MTRKLIFGTAILMVTGLLLGMTNYTLYWYQHKGYIITNDDVRTEGVVELDGWGRLWMSQGTVGFCPESKIDTIKKSPKIKCKWYKSNALKEYGYDSKRFVTKKIKLTVGNVNRMLEVISESEKTYKFYSSDNGTTEIKSNPDNYSIYKENASGILVRIK